MRFEGNSILPKSLKLDFFPLKLDFPPIKLDFSAILRKFYILWWILEKNLSGVTLFKPFLLTKCLEKSKNLQFFKKIVLKNSETRFQKGETRFQNAETRFQNAKTYLSCIFYARTGMDSAQKKACTGYY